MQKQFNLTPFQIDTLRGKVCPYCKCGTRDASQEEVYNGNSYSKRRMRVCNNFPHCDAYVGCDDSGIPLGRLARPELRRKRKEAHEVVDQLWKKGYMKRQNMYKELWKHLGLPKEYTHIGMFGLNTCIRVIMWGNEQLVRFENAPHGAPFNNKRR